jgi:predicted GIY-YIG superfamily endonuclease
LARETGISRATLSKARRILKSGDQDLLDEVLMGEITLNAADRIIRGTPKKIKVAVYRHYDRKGNLLYVGMTDDPHARLKAHRRDSQWVDQAATFTGEWFDSWMDAKWAETVAIQTEKPLFNVSEAGRKRK